MAQKISVIIPNYNGEKILSENLPKVLENCSGCEIIIVDDASDDDSQKLIKEKFTAVKLITNEKNMGFARTVNRGVKNAAGDLILLLNSDVAPRKDFLKPALSHFKNKKVFALGLTDYSHENNKVVRKGRGGAKFEKGFLNHFALPIKRGETFWVSGGSGVFVKSIFQELGGFDPIYAPFYWEDVDLSFRARLSGYICLFEPTSKVDHYHQKGAIKTTRGEFTIKAVSYRNQFIFVWKNFSDPIFLLQHLYWLPYHFLKATVQKDFAFFLGFLQALEKIPNLVFNSRYKIEQRTLSEREIIKKFEK